tara:strand:+ start:375 stop:1307 length:933 start_codon:yes stop_codon:yes gene_type:complete
LTNSLNDASKNDLEIDLLEVLDTLLTRKLFIFLVTSIFAIGSVFYSLSVPDKYKAITVLAPAQSEGEGISVLGQLGGLASLAGVNVPGNATNQSLIAQEIMISQSFIEKFIYSNQLERDIYASVGWNKSDNSLKFDSEIYDSLEGKWKLMDGISSNSGPSSWMLFTAFKDILNVSENKQTGMVTVSIEFYSPYLANDWLNAYVEEINSHMQKRKILSASRNIDYLQNQVEKTSIAEMQGVFYTIIEDQIKSKMLAEASPEYAFVVVNPSMVPGQRSAPNRALICVVGASLGLLLSVMSVLIIYFKKKIYL